jgi:hypothetical protein
MVMLSTKYLVNDYKTVPETWVFQHYCKLSEKLTGQDVKLKSVFNPKEKTPSMCVYLHRGTGKYKFKDFSTGKQGSCVDLVKEIFKLDFKDAARKIVADYNEYTLHNNGSYDVEEFKQHSKYKVVSSEIRNWNTKDQYFWTQFNIGTKLLNSHYVCPLDSYTLSKTDENGVVDELVISGDHIYGYYKKDGTLYKIYQPKVQKKKFIKVTDYIQGSDQLAGHNHLVITSSLKDILSLKSLGLKVDTVAPDSENTMIPKEKMKELIKKYSYISVMLDNDDAGIAAMKKYRDQYGFTPILLTMSKDISDSIKEHGVDKVKVKLIPMLSNVPILEKNS